MNLIILTEADRELLDLGVKADIVEKADLPMKVWSDCARCPKQQECDEIAVAKAVSDTP